MKYIILNIVVLFVILSFLGCGEESEPVSAKDQKLVELQNGGSPWILGNTGSVTKDGFDVTEQFKDFRLTIEKFTYTVENSSGNAWPQNSGTWEFANDNGSVIVRDGFTNIGVLINGNALNLSFTSTSAGGRVSYVEGDYIFSLRSE